MNKINWHRIFGLTLANFFYGSNFKVELEKEVTEKKQFLDIVIIKQTTGTPISELAELPDGLEQLAEYNLLTYKSIQESLTAWTIKELISYYVSYRKQQSPASSKLIPEHKFKLFAISTIYPLELLKKIPHQQMQQGVFTLFWGTDEIKLLILSEMPLEQRNAIWQLFSGQKEKFIYGNQWYKWHSEKMRVILKPLYRLYHLIGELFMSYTLDDYFQEVAKEHIRDVPLDEILKVFSIDEILQRVSPEKRLEGLSPEKRLEGLSPEKRLEGLSPEKRLEGLSPDEVLQRYSPEKRLEGLSPEKIEAFLKNLKK